MNVNVEVRAAVASAKGMLKPSDLQTAMRDAVKRTTVTFIARGSRQIATSLNARIAAIKATFTVEDKATKKNPEAWIVLGRVKAPIRQYMTGAQIAASRKRPPGGARVRVFKGGVIERHKHSFISVMKFGTVALFHRGDKSRSIPGAKRWDVHEEYGPTTVGVFHAQKDTEGPGTIEQATCDDASNVLLKNINSQIDRFLAKYAAQK